MVCCRRGGPPESAGADDRRRLLRPAGRRGGCHARLQDPVHLPGAAAICQRMDAAVSCIDNCTISLCFNIYICAAVFYRCTLLTCAPLPALAVALLAPPMFFF